MIKKKAFLIFYSLALMSGSDIKAQKHALKELSIGEDVPDIELKMINYKSQKLKLSDLKGKLVILDFWSTWCSVCLKQFPRLTKLQQQNKKDVFILPVGFDANEKGSITRFITKRKGTDQQLNLPVAIQEKKDSVLMKLFPFYGLPHEVWIDKNGKLLAITDHNEVTEVNIQKVLINRNATLTEKKYDKDFDRFKPLFLNGNGGTGNQFIARSLITPYLNGVSSLGFKHYTDSAMTRLFITNATVFLLYKLPYQYIDTVNTQDLELDYLNKRFLIESKQTSLFKDWPDEDLSTGAAIDSFKRNHLYTYELIMPPSNSLNEAYKTMLQDLNRLFHLNSSVEKRKVKCLALVRTSEVDKMKSSQNNKTPYQFAHVKDSLVFKNNSLSLFTRYFNMHWPLSVIVDETNYSDNVDIGMNLKDKSLAALRQELSRYDLDLIETEKELDMIVLKDQY